MEKTLFLFWLLLRYYGAVGQTLGSPSIAANSTNPDYCEECPKCKPCSTCARNIAMAFVITSLITALLLAIVYVPILIVVSSGSSKIVPKESQMGTTKTYKRGHRLKVGSGVN